MLFAINKMRRMLYFSVKFDLEIDNYMCKALMFKLSIIVFIVDCTNFTFLPFAISSMHVNMAKNVSISFVLFVILLSKTFFSLNSSFDLVC